MLVVRTRLLLRESSSRAVESEKEAHRNSSSSWKVVLNTPAQIIWWSSSKFIQSTCDYRESHYSVECEVNYRNYLFKYIVVGQCCVGINYPNVTMNSDQVPSGGSAVAASTTTTPAAMDCESSSGSTRTSTWKNNNNCNGRQQEGHNCGNIRCNQNGVVQPLLTGTLID